MIGSEYHANMALDRAINGVAIGAIGDGTTRDVYLINDIVYKVDKEFHEGTNVIEYENIIAKSPMLSNNVLYPRTSLLPVNDTFVIAMDYIIGQPIARCYCLPNESCDRFCMTNKEETLVCQFIGDTSGFNVIRTAHGDYFIIDAAV